MEIREFFPSMKKEGVDFSEEDIKKLTDGLYDPEIDAAIESITYRELDDSGRAIIEEIVDDVLSQGLDPSIGDRFREKLIEEYTHSSMHPEVFRTHVLKKIKKKDGAK